MQDYDPLDFSNLKDPNFKDLDEATRSHKAFELHCNRMLTAVKFIRAPVKFAVACDFAKHGWIPEETLQKLVDSQNGSLLDPFTQSDHSESSDDMSL